MNDLQVQIIGTMLFLSLAMQVVQMRYIYRIRRRLQKKLP
jgi:hypothetical protein